MAHRDDSPRSPSEIPPPLRWGMEIVLLAMLVAAPWMYAAVHPGFEFVLDVGLAVLLVLWALRMLWQWQVVVARCPVTILLAVLLLLGLWQITPLPDAVLRTIAPETADLYDRLLPATPESLPEAPSAAASQPDGHTLSLAPGATRAYCFRLLAVLLVFSVVRNNLASVGVLTRLSVVMVANGFALCLFGIIQRLTSPPQTLYWTYPTLGGVFGPFISRNMFPYFVNMCLGLGVGLILARIGRQTGDNQRTRRERASADGPQALSRAAVFWLQDPPSLWLVAAVAFMGSTVAFSLSRGGFAAMLAGLLFVVALGRTSQSRGLRVVGLAMVAGLGLFFLAWLGMPLVESRVKTLTEPDKADQARWPLWSRVAPLVSEFPAWGTGLGSFPYVEVWSRQDKALLTSPDSGKTAPLEASLFDHAHNDYIEIAVEAGLPGLAVMLAIVVLIFRYGLRAVALFPGGRRAGLATGILCGLTAVAIHSLVDFGMHAPAIALLATVLSAMVSGLGSERPSPLSTPAAWRLRLGGLAPLVAGATVVLLGLMVCAHTWGAHRVERLQAAAAKVPGNEPRRRSIQLPYLEAAAKLAPQNAAIRMELAQAHLDLLQAEVGRAERLDRLGFIADYCMIAPSLIVGGGAGFPAVVFPVTSDSHWIARKELLDEERLQASQRHLYIALEQAIAARDANPLMPEAQFMLGLYAAALAKGDSQRGYYDRVKFLAPRYPEVWYYSGSSELAAGHYEEAWKDWRACLNLTDRFFDLILFRAAGVLPPKELIVKVLPDRAELLARAAVRLFPREKQGADRKVFNLAALGVLARQEQSLSFEQLRLKMRLQLDSNQWQAAEQTALQLLERQSTNHEVRLDLARLYFHAGEWDKAEREARMVPGNDRARKLLQDIQLAQEAAKSKRVD